MSRYLMAVGVGLVVLAGSALVLYGVGRRIGHLKIGSDGRVCEVRVEAVRQRLVREPVEVVAPRTVAQTGGGLSAN